MTATSAERASFGYAFAVQTRVIGALIMRELHTRYGRDNIGYLWLFLEPGLLAAGVATVHYFADIHLPWGMEIVPFYVSGYSCYQLFRSLANRAGATVEANGSLLFHRPVTMFDLLLSRALLDAGSMMSAGLLILAASGALGVGHLPARPLVFFEAWGMNLWFCFALSMLILAGNIVFPALDKFVHPATYLILPMSNAFTIFEQMPSFVIPYISWWPLSQINEMIREGMFADFDSQYVSSAYIVLCCAILTCLGLLALRAVRSKVVFE